MKSAISIAIVALAVLVKVGESAVQCPQIPTIADLDTQKVRSLPSWFKD
jgi:hypothetical protein